METRVSQAVLPLESGLSPLVLAGLLVGPFMSMIDSSVVNVALAAIARSLHTDLAAAQWVISSYLLALALGLPASAFLAKRFGTRRVYLLSILAFSVSSLACAFAPTLPLLIVTRTLQGFSGAPLVPLAMNILLDPNGVARRGIPPTAGIVLFLAPALGPTLGGLVLRVGGGDAWPLIFLINVPVGLVGLLGAAHISLDLAGRGDGSAHFDPAGLLLLGGGLAMMIYGATAAVQTSWLAENVWPFWCGGIALLLTYALYALNRPSPALDLRLLRHSQSALALFLVCLVSFVMSAMLLLIPIYLQLIQGAPPLVAGLVLLPQGLIMGLGVLLGNVLTSWWGERVCIIFGTVILVATTVLLLMLALSTPAWMTALLLTGRGLATGLVLPPLLAVMLHGLAPRELPDGNTLFTVTDNLSGSVGISLLATLFQQQAVAHVAAVLKAHGIAADTIQNLGSAGTSASGGGSLLPAALRHLFGEAAMAGLHDTILAMVVVAVCGVIAALFLQSPPHAREMNVKQPVDHGNELE